MEDRLDTLFEVKSQRDMIAAESLGLYLADWGYNMPAQRDKAAAEPFAVFSQEALAAAAVSVHFLKHNNLQPPSIKTDELFPFDDVTTNPPILTQINPQILKKAEPDLFAECHADTIFVSERKEKATK